MGGPARAQSCASRRWRSRPITTTCWRPGPPQLDIWETEYQQVLEGPESVAEFTKGTWLKPILDALDPGERPEFEARYKAKLAASLPPPRRWPGAVRLPPPVHHCGPQATTDLARPRRPATMAAAIAVAIGGMSWTRNSGRRAAGSGSKPSGRAEFDPATVDAAAFHKACAAAAKDWSGKLKAARAAASAKHAVYMTFAIIAVIAIIAILIAAAVASRGEGGGRMFAVVPALFRWAKRAAYGSYWSLRRQAKAAVLTKVLPTINLGYSVTTGRFPTTAFKSAGLMPSDGALEDHISGRHNGVDFHLCESTSGHAKGEAEDGPDVWEGVLFAFAYRKKFRGRTLIVRDGGAIGNFFKGFGKDGERITLEDPRFEERFEVFGSDQVEARYLLTPAFMERLVDLDTRYGGKKLKAAFADDKLLLTIDDRQDRFELHLEEGVRHGEAEKLLRDLEIPCQIIDALKLDAQTVA